MSKSYSTSDNPFGSLDYWCQWRWWCDLMTIPSTHNMNRNQCRHLRKCFHLVPCTAMWRMEISLPFGMRLHGMYRLTCGGLCFPGILKDDYWRTADEAELRKFEDPLLNPSPLVWVLVIWPDSGWILSPVSTKIRLPVLVSISSTGQPTHIKTINGLIVQTLPHAFTMAISRLSFRNFQIRDNWYKHS